MTSLLNVVTRTRCGSAREAPITEADQPLDEDALFPLPAAPITAVNLSSGVAASYLKLIEGQVIGSESQVQCLERRCLVLEGG